jgi:hypothetical protein
VSAIAQRVPRATVRPAEWDALMPDDGERIPWQVWMRWKGSGYWIHRWATKLARFTSRVERALGREVPPCIGNPNGLEEPATVWTEGEAQDLCRLIRQKYGRRMAVTYGPLLVGRVHPFESVKAVGDQKFDPFGVYDFSATDAVNKQARHMLITVEEYEQTRAILTGALAKPEPRV